MVASRLWQTEDRHRGWETLLPCCRRAGTLGGMTSQLKDKRTCMCLPRQASCSIAYIIHCDLPGIAARSNLMFGRLSANPQLKPSPSTWDSCSIPQTDLDPPWPMIFMARRLKQVVFGLVKDINTGNSPGSCRDNHEVSVQELQHWTALIVQPTTTQAEAKRSERLSEPLQRIAISGVMDRCMGKCRHHHCGEQCTVHGAMHVPQNPATSTGDYPAS